MNKIQTEIQDVWFGRVKLWKVFWLHTSVIGTILSLIIDFLFFSGQFLLSIAFLAVYTIFVIWISKGLYACRFNVKNPEGLIPKLTIVFIVLNLFLFFFFHNLFILTFIHYLLKKVTLYKSADFVLKIRILFYVNQISRIWSIFGEGMSRYETYREIVSLNHLVNGWFTIWSSSFANYLMYTNLYIYKFFIVY